MSETALTLIESAFKKIGVLPIGETLPGDYSAHGLKALQFMLRRWSASNLRLFYTETDTVTLTGAASYTIGSGGDCDTVRPSSIRGGYVRDSDNHDYPFSLIDESQYRAIVVKSLGGTTTMGWYNPEYPLGVIYVWPLSTGTLYLDSLKALTDPSALTTSVTFPPEYDEAIIYNLAIRLAPDFDAAKVDDLVIATANNALHDIETKNFAEQMNASRLEIIKTSGRYRINEG